MASERLTYLLRPNVTRPDFFAPTSIATPPVTDIDSSSQFDTESDFTDGESFSEVEDVASLAASSRESLVHIRAIRVAHDAETWSVHGGTDVEADLSGSESVIPAMRTLSIGDDTTPRRITTIRSRHAQHHGVVRSSSSPSRSPVRLSFSQRQRPVAAVSKPSFYNYLFS